MRNILLFLLVSFSALAQNATQINIPFRDATTTIKGRIRLAGDLGGTANAPTVPALATKEPLIGVGTTSQYWRGDKTWQTLDKTVVGLGNVDNTSDANKPVSTATQTALNLKVDKTSVLGTTNYVSKFTSAGTIGDSQIFDNGVSVGIRTNNPQAPLDINGNVNFSSGGLSRGIAFYFNNRFNLQANANSAGLDIGTSTNNSIAFYTNNVTQTKFVILGNGNLLAGGTVDEGYKTDIAGTLRATNSAYFATTSGGVAIGATSINSSSILDINSTTKGVLLPRLTTAQINAITTPADGLTVYNTDLKTICFYDGAALIWKRVSHSNM